jgi:hypothetical protein
MWQRVWASHSRRALHGGAAIGCTAIVLLVFLSGFGGWLSLVGGYATPESNQNLILMQARCCAAAWCGACCVHAAVACGVCVCV